MAKRKKQKKQALSKLIKALPTCLLIMIISVGVCLGVMIEAGILRIDKVQDALGFTVFQSSSDSSLPDEDELLAVYIIDVGQGDSTLITAGGKSILIDAGESEYAGTVSSFISSKGIDHLDYIIATHPHSDHIGAMSEIISSFGADKIIVPRLPDEMIPTTKTYEKFLLSVKNSGSKLTAAVAGTEYEISEINGMPVIMTVLAPVDSADYSDLNNYSVCIRLDYGITSWLFTGDLSKEGERDLLSSGADIDVTAYKVAHHGSSSSSSEDFIKAVSPALCVISCETGNSYGHPNDEVMERLSGFTQSIYRTDLNSSVSVYSDGERLYVSSEKEAQQ